MGRVGFVGIGIMGSRMAARLLAAGHEVTVWNRTPEKAAKLVESGAILAASPALAAEGKDICFTNMAHGAALKAVCLGPDGILEAAALPALLVDMGTVGPAESAEIAAAAEASGVGYLRSPVSGSTVLAEAGKLTILASGEQATYDAADAHSYAPYPADVAGQLAWVRARMKPGTMLFASELGWEDQAWTHTQAQQAEDLSARVTAAATIADVPMWFLLRDVGSNGVPRNAQHNGLLTSGGQRKAAFESLRSLT